MGNIWFVFYAGEIWHFYIWGYVTLRRNKTFKRIIQTHQTVTFIPNGQCRCNIWSEIKEDRSPQEVQVVVNAFLAVFFKKGKLYAVNPLYNISTYLPT